MYILLYLLEGIFLCPKKSKKFQEQEKTGMLMQAPKVVLEWVTNGNKRDAHSGPGRFNKH